MNKHGTPLKNLTKHISQGIHSGGNEILFVNVVERGNQTSKIRSAANDEVYEIETELLPKLVRGTDIRRYSSLETNLGVVYPYTGQDSTLLTPSRLEQKYPKTYAYLEKFKEELSNRGSEGMEYPEWYALWRSREKQVFESRKLITPDVCQRPEFTLDDDGQYYLADTGYSIVLEENTPQARHFLLSTLNSSLTWFYIYKTGTVLRGDFRRFKTAYLSPLPVPMQTLRHSYEGTPKDYNDIIDKTTQIDELPDERFGDNLASLGRTMFQLQRKYDQLNHNLLDYLGNYSDGPTLSKLGYQPPAGLSNSLLTQTESDASDFEKLRVTEARAERDDGNVTVFAVPYVKPVAEEEYETNSRGYATLDAIPAMQFSDLSELQAIPDSSI